MDMPAIGTRISVAGSLGTVKFAGSVDNTKGVWLGVEWDDPDRGKHSGTKDGKHYFECRIPNAGSFIRPSASVCYGISFLTALRSKYIEMQHGTASLEKVVLGSSKGAIEVEAVGLDKIRGKFAQLERLREISVDYENVATADSPGEVRNACSNVRGADLSSNLLPSWDMVALIAVEMPQLEILALNRNRLAPFKNTLKATLAFPKLTELQLNGTLMTWSEVGELVLVIPSLRLVEMGYNRLRRLSSSPTLAKPSIHVVNLDGNELDDWPHICETFQPYRNLGRLILSSNRIRTIPPVTAVSPLLLGITHLALSFNDLRAWRDIDSLSQWCPTLETLSLRGNHLLEDPQMGRYARQLVISKIPSLRALDAAAISSKERIDCELFYLSHISKGEPVSDEERLREHPRWADLCAKHGRPEDVAKPRQDKLSNQLIQLNIHRCNVRPPLKSRAGSLPLTLSSITLQVLPAMPVRTFRLKVFKCLKTPEQKLAQVSVELWLKMQGDTLAVIDREQDEYDLGWWGLESGSDVYVYIDTRI